MYEEKWGMKLSYECMGENGSSTSISRLGNSLRGLNDETGILNRRRGFWNAWLANSWRELWSLSGLVLHTYILVYIFSTVHVRVYLSFACECISIKRSVCACAREMEKEATSIRVRTRFLTWTVSPLALARGGTRVRAWRRGLEIRNEEEGAGLARSRVWNSYLC